MSRQTSPAPRRKGWVDPAKEKAAALARMNIEISASDSSPTPRTCPQPEAATPRPTFSTITAQVDYISLCRKCAWKHSPVPIKNFSMSRHECRHCGTVAPVTICKVTPKPPPTSAPQQRPTRCPSCRTVAAELVCHLCKTVRPFWQRIRIKQEETTPCPAQRSSR